MSGWFESPSAKSTCPAASAWTTLAPPPGTKITEKGKDALLIFATDRRCSDANIVGRKELFDKGVKSVEARSS